MDDVTVRDRLLDAALALFAERGYDEVSVEKIRNLARVSNGSFFHLFANKAELAAELLVDCVLDYQAAVIRSLDDVDDAADGIEAIIGTHLRWVQRNRARARFMFDEARSAWFALAAERLKVANERYLQVIETWRAPLVKRGAMQPVPADVFSAVVIGPTNMLCRFWLTGLKPSATPIRHQQELVACACAGLIPGWNSRR